MKIEYDYKKLAKEFFGWKERYSSYQIPMSDAKIKSYLFRYYHPPLGLTFNTEGFKEFIRNLDEAIANVQAPKGD